jgi:hypothetical protein
LNHWAVFYQWLSVSQPPVGAGPPFVCQLLGNPAEVRLEPVAGEAESNPVMGCALFFMFSVIRHLGKVLDVAPPCRKGIEYLRVESRGQERFDLVLGLGFF